MFEFIKSVLQENNNIRIDQIYKNQSIVAILGILKKLIYFGFINSSKEFYEVILPKLLNLQRTTEL